MKVISMTKSYILREVMPRTEKMTSNRVIYLDLLKILAAFVTVFYHLAYYRLDYGFIAGEKYIPNLNRIIMCFASCGVPLFFMVNGALMLSKKRNNTYIFYKSAKIIGLCYALKWTNFPNWFLMTLAFLYICIPVFQYLYESKKVLFYMILAMVFLFPFTYNFILFVLKAVAGIVPEVTIEILGSPVNITGLNVTGGFRIYSILYFCVGYLIFRDQKKHKLGCYLVCMLFGLGFVVIECIAYTNYDFVMHDSVNNAFPTIGALMLSIGIFGVFKNTEKWVTKNLSKTALFFSDSIFIIYVFHLLIITKLQVIGQWQIGLADSIVRTCFVVANCVVIAKVLNKIPGICYFSNI